MEIEQILEECRNDLLNFFCNSPPMIWKEEDLQSYLYHLLLIRDKDLRFRVHREYPIIFSWMPRNWAGYLDIAIVNDTKNGFRLQDARITHAIELKFLRDWKTGRSPRSLKKFENECERDCSKLLSKGINFNPDSRKYFWAFRYVEESQISDVRKIMESINWKDIEWIYVESYTDGSPYKTLLSSNGSAL
ncbi:MAG: hypothetical protein U9N41_03565 [Euryarchaeota archaeon]|nr:hypothetical protein [Euryarchaeota archaeon]